MIKNYKKSILIGCTAIVSLTLFSFSDPGGRFFEIAKNLDIYATLFKELNTYYVDDLNPNKVMKNSINAMLKQLDPYTNYYAEDDIEDYRTMTTGEYNGIGAVITQVNEKLQVLEVYEDSPAAKAGLQVGDEIVKLDNFDVKGKQEADLNSLIKGQNGTILKAQVLKYGATKPTTINITRDVVKMLNVPYSGMVNETVGYIYLNDFSSTAAKEVKQAYNNLKSEGMKELIFDLRDNPGGLLNMAVEICNMFVEKDAEIVSTKGKVSTWNKVYKATQQATDLEIPIIVLTNGRSASASEIVSGVLQDYDRAVVLGQKSFGKGLVQVTRDLSYNCKLKVTTAKYYTPSGRCIQAIDYSNRNADGSVGKVPDSLINKFYTKNKRLVYDGGGIAPDVAIDKADKPVILNSLAQEMLLFEYANKYLFEHPNIKTAADFNFTEADYGDFANWLKSKNFKYNTQIEKDLESLEASAKKEKYLAGIQDQFGALKAKIASQKKDDVNLFKAEIKEALEKEILSHKFYQKELKKISFAKDKEVQAALNLFKNPTKYKSILAGNQ